MKKVSLFMVISSLLLITACGGGGDRTRAVVRIGTAGVLPEGVLLGAVHIKLSLPAGVTIKASPDSANPSVLVADAGVIAPSEWVMATYAPAAGPVPGSVTISIVKAEGMGLGEIAAVVCDFASGTSLNAADFSLFDFDPRDLDGAHRETLTAGFTVEFL